MWQQQQRQQQRSAPSADWCTRPKGDDARQQPSLGTTLACLPLAGTFCCLLCFVLFSVLFCAFAFLGGCLGDSACGETLSLRVALPARALFALRSLACACVRSLSLALSLLLRSLCKLPFCLRASHARTAAAAAALWPNRRVSQLPTLQAQGYSRSLPLLPTISKL